jgi:hypothetical protein
MNSLSKDSEIISMANPPLTRSKTLPSEKGTVNYLEDLALTQTMFEKGTLICNGEAEDFVNIIRANRNSIQNMDSENVREYIEKHPDLLEGIDTDSPIPNPNTNSHNSPNKEDIAVS